MHVLINVVSLTPDLSRFSLVYEYHRIVHIFRGVVQLIEWFYKSDNKAVLFAEGAGFHRVVDLFVYGVAFLICVRCLLLSDMQGANVVCGSARNYNL